MADFAEIALARGLAYMADTQAAIAHNLANVQSTAFKRRTSHAVQSMVDFGSMLDARMPTLLYAERTGWSQGDLKATGNSFHVGLEGDGFFLVKSAEGQLYYTRNGEMTLDHEGRLSTTDGLRFLDANGQEIVLRNDQGSGPSSLLVSPDGRITDGLGGNQSWGPLGVFRVADRGKLQPAGNSLYIDSSRQQPLRATSTVVRHKQLERSNVDTLQEMIRMISVQRGFQATSRTMTVLGRIRRSFIAAINR